MTIEDDRASDKRFFLTFAAVLVAEVVLGVLADAGTINLEVWLVLAILVVLAAGGATAVLQRRHPL